MKIQIITFEDTGKHIFPSLSRKFFESLAIHYGSNMVEVVFLFPLSFGLRQPSDSSPLVLLDEVLDWYLLKFVQGYAFIIVEFMLSLCWILSVVIVEFFEYTLFRNGTDFIGSLVIEPQMTIQEIWWKVKQLKIMRYVLFDVQIMMMLVIQ